MTQQNKRRSGTNGNGAYSASSSSAQYHNRYDSQHNSIDFGAMIPAVAKALLGDHNKHLSTSVSLRYGHQGSLTINITKGCFFDHEAGCGGGTLGLIQHVNRCDKAGAIAWLKAFDPQAITDTEQRQFVQRQPARQRATDDHKIKCALHLWDQANPITGTIVETYLQSRSLTLKRSEDVIRFHPSCPFGSERHPCMVSLFRDIRTDDPCGIHRTALTPDSRKIDRKMMGRSKGAAIKLCADDNVTTGLGIAEGIETALSVMATGWQPIWALGSAGSVRDFHVLAGIESLTIFADHDEAGLKASHACGTSWGLSGRECRIIKPPVMKTDFNDSLRELRHAA